MKSFEQFLNEGLKDSFECVLTEKEVIDLVKKVLPGWYCVVGQRFEDETMYILGIDKDDRRVFFGSFIIQLINKGRIIAVGGERCAYEDEFLIYDVNKSDTKSYPRLSIPKQMGNKMSRGIWEHGSCFVLKDLEKRLLSIKKKLVGMYPDLDRKVW